MAQRSSKTGLQVTAQTWLVRIFSELGDVRPQAGAGPGTSGEQKEAVDKSNPPTPAMMPSLQLGTVPTHVH